MGRRPAALAGFGAALVALGLSGVSLAQEPAPAETTPAETTPAETTPAETTPPPLPPAPNAETAEPLPEPVPEPAPPVDPEPPPAEMEAEPGPETSGAPVAEPHPAPEEPDRAAAPADPTRDAPEPPDDGRLGWHQDHLAVLLGVRSSLVSHAGLDPFSENDALIQLTLGAGGVLLTEGAWSFAALAIWDAGGKGSEARGLDTQIIAHRFSLGAEGRYHVIRQLFAFARVAPGAVHSIVSLTEPGSIDREARDWAFAADLSAGAQLEVSGFSTPSGARRPSGWVGVEGGYGWASATSLSLAAGEDPNAEGELLGPERGEPLDLGRLALRGPFFRVMLALSY